MVGGVFFSKGKMGEREKVYHLEDVVCVIGKGFVLLSTTSAGV